MDSVPIVEGPLCDRCGCPSPSPETLHEPSGTRICQACEEADANAAAIDKAYDRAMDDAFLTNHTGMTADERGYVG